MRPHQVQIFVMTSMSSHSNSDTTELAKEHSTEMTTYEHVCTPSTLPFPCYSKKWYKKQGKLSRKNTIRETCRSSHPLHKDEKDSIMWVNCSKASGSLEDNIALLETKLLSQRNSSHYHAISEVGKFILSSGPIVATQDAAQVYMNMKGSKKRKKSGELYEILSKHLNIIQVHLDGKDIMLGQM